MVLAFLLQMVIARGAEPMNDTFDLLRRRWVASLVGDEHLDITLPVVRERIEAQDREARERWQSMVKTPGDDLWPDLKTATNSAGLTATCGRLGVLSRAYAMKGSTLYHDPGLREDLLNGIRWFIAARYHPGAAPFGNWWDWQIGVPLALNPCLACLYDELPAATLKDATDAIEAFTPVISATGANGAWRAEIMLRRAILVQDAAKMQVVQTWMEKAMLPYFEPPDDLTGTFDGFREGFYRDGSFFAHGRNPYNGGYGVSALASSAGLMALVAATPWDVAGPNRGNVDRWIRDGLMPLLYRGTLFDNVRGREISRGGINIPGLPPGAAVLAILLTAAEIVPGPDQAPLRSYVKGMATPKNAVGLPAPDAARLSALLADRTVPAAAAPTLFRHYPLMARTTMLREGFGASVGMYSDAVYDYEQLNRENLKGWHTADGWLQILDADSTQFSDGYWPSVDWHRLPGTTAVRGSIKPSSLPNGSSWAGGADLDGVNGVTGFELLPFSGRVYPPGARESVPATDGQTLTARKSWFMLGDEIFCVGTGITATDAEPVETTIENHRLAGEGNQVLTVDGDPQLPATGPRTLTARWLHLEGNVPGSSLGCVFTEPTRVQSLRETRTGTWRNINASGDDTPIQRRFLTLWLDHGVKPTGAAYAFVLLPGRSAAAVARYAAAPATVLLAATGRIHAVAHRTLGIIAANVWEDAPTTLALDGQRQMTVDRKACVLYRHRDGVTEIAVSDPTRADRTAIILRLNVPLGRVLEAGGPVSVEVSASGTLVKLDLSHLGPDERGNTFKIRLAD